MSESMKAVFLSYASQDAAAVSRIRDALEAVDIPVWFDQEELKGGDAWDAAIRKRIKECALFVPVISAATDSRDEGYFRLEWKLAVDRSNLIAGDRIFLLPVTLDGSRQSTARVPERFLEVQWSSVTDADGLAAFAQRVKRLLDGAEIPGEAARHSTAPAGAPVRASASSVAVLPFANLSRDHENEYFADGLTEELLNVLANIRGLRVASRTSAFYFKGRELDLPTIARRLNVGTVLEGSVRKSGKRVRITAQLIEVSTDSHLWSRTYDRELDDIFAVQDDIAQSVVAELRRLLVGHGAIEAAKAVASEVRAAALGRTENADAHELFLQARFLINQWTSESSARARDLLEQAVALDSRFAMAWSELSLVLFSLTVHGALPSSEGYGLAGAAARKSLEVEPGFAEGYVALARVLEVDWKWGEVTGLLERALELSPNNPRVLRNLGRHVAHLGRQEEGIEYHRRARLVDPLSPVSHFNLGGQLLLAGHLDEAEAAYKRAFDINPSGGGVHAGLALTYLCRGEPARALETIALERNSMPELCIRAMAEHSLGHRDRADEALAAMISNHGNYAFYQIATVHAWRGDNEGALQWLEDACANRDSGLAGLAIDPFFAGLRGEPKYRELLRKVGLPVPGLNPSPDSPWTTARRPPPQASP